VWLVLFKGTVTTVPYGCFVVGMVPFGSRAGARPARTFTLYQLRSCRLVVLT